MIVFRCLLALSGAWAARGETVQRAGWLERAVRFYRQNFIADVQRVAPIQIQASLEPAPVGYVDSGAWDYPAVQRLLALLAANDAAAPVRRALRRALRPSRRYVSLDKTYKLFPSKGKGHPNEIYYDFNYDQYYSETEGEGEGEAVTDEAVVMVRNPVEARLPSAQISVKLLREILEARALAARQMPSTASPTIVWIPMNKSKVASAGYATTPGGNATAPEGGGDPTTGGGADSALEVEPDSASVSGAGALPGGGADSASVSGAGALPGGGADSASVSGAGALPGGGADSASVSGAGALPGGGTGAVPGGGTDLGVDSVVDNGD